MANRWEKMEMVTDFIFLSSKITAHGDCSHEIQRYFLLKATLVAQIVRNPPVSAGDPGSIPGLGKFPGEGNGYSLQYFCLENPMDR